MDENNAQWEKFQRWLCLRALVILLAMILAMAASIALAEGGSKAGVSNYSSVR